MVLASFQHPTLDGCNKMLIFNTTFLDSQTVSAKVSKVYNMGRNLQELIKKSFSDLHRGDILYMNKDIAYFLY